MAGRQHYANGGRGGRFPPQQPQQLAPGGWSPPYPAPGLAAAPPPYAVMGSSAGWQQYPHGAGGYGGPPSYNVPPQAHHAFVPQHQQPPVNAAVQLSQVEPHRLCKAVAKVAKPCPPWCLGSSTSVSLTQEMRDFARFTLLRPAERQAIDRLAQDVASCVQSVWPSAALVPVAMTAVNLLPSGVAPQYAVIEPQSGSDPRDEERLHNTFLAAGVDARPLGTDPRGSTLWQVSRGREATSLILRTGRGCNEAVAAGREFGKYFGSMNDCDAALLGIDAVMRQSKFLSDVEFKDHISSEALMVMLLAIVNSYDSSDTEPRTAQRITQDFFLTYGFEQNCDPANRSITHLGMQADVGRHHQGDELSVLDVVPGSATPANLSRGLTQNSLKVLIALFHYCFSVISNFVKEQDVAKRRAQSALSTVLGGESYWDRLIQLYRMEEQPFTSFVRSKEQAILQAALESDVPQGMGGGFHGGRGGGGRPFRRF